MSHLKTPFLFHFTPGPNDEPSIQNEEFLRSHYSFGTGLRLVTIYQQYKVLQNSKATPLERFAAVSALYQTIGMLYEDMAATVVAWAVWAKNRTLLLADVYERLFLTSKRETASVGRLYLDKCIESFSTTTRTVRICPQQYFESLMALEGEELLRTLGIPWKPSPSVKLVPRDRHFEWSKLPVVSKGIFHPLAGKNSTFLTTSYNKLKHGPQMVVMNPYAIAVDKRGIVDIPSQQRDVIDNSYIRLLFGGARTQEKASELEAGARVAPFLIHQQEIVQTLVDTFICAGLFVRILAWWLFLCVFRTPLARKDDPIIDEMRRWSKNLTLGPLS